MVVPSSGYHFPLSAPDRIASLVDEGTFAERDANLRSTDPLDFKGIASYKDKLGQNKEKTGLEDAVVCGVGKIGGKWVSLSVMDFPVSGRKHGFGRWRKDYPCDRAGTGVFDSRRHCLRVGRSPNVRRYSQPHANGENKRLLLARLSEAGIPYVSI